MVQAEGDFPKTGNDPMYASEYNNFNPKLIGTVSQGPSVVTFNSGTAWTSMGVVNYSGANMPINSWMNFRTFIQSREDSNDDTDFRVHISGPGVDMGAVTKTAKIADQHVWIDYYMTSEELVASGGNTGSNYDITLEAKTADDGQNYAKNDFTVWGH